MLNNVDRLSKHWEALANAVTLGSDGARLMPTDVKQRTKVERTEFGNRFAAVMARVGLTTPQLIETALDKKWSARQVSYLYTADYKTASDPKETGPLLLACAQLAKTTIEAFFVDDLPADSKAGTNNELIDMVTKALDGPKAEFLADAIEMAYSAAVMSKSNYKRHG